MYSLAASKKSDSATFIRIWCVTNSVLTNPTIPNFVSAKHRLRQQNSNRIPIDLITDTEVIEVKDIKNWKHAVGQIFAYWYYLDNRDELSPRIYLFGGDGIDDNRIQLCKSLTNKIFCFDVEVIVTYSE
ncbi:hypothetical protein Cal6303_5024 [Calothrix sp. PCC 6303]|nr:hypothetical protein Cal6303_5024 [Calothrix sp. PCC 6303]